MWVAILSAEISQLKGQRKIAIVMNAPVFEEAEDIDRERGSRLGSISNRGVDYLITNVEGEDITEQWIVETYGQRNWVEVFYREAKGWLGLSVYYFL